MVGHNINVKLFFQGAFIIGNLKCSVMPEIFYRESMFLNTFGPRLKDCRGDEEVGIHVFLPLNNLDS